MTLPLRLGPVRVFSQCAIQITRSMHAFSPLVLSWCPCPSCPSRGCSLTSCPGRSSNTLSQTISSRRFYSPLMSPIVPLHTHCSRTSPKCPHVLLLMIILRFSIYTLIAFSWRAIFFRVHPWTHANEMSILSAVPASSNLISAPRSSSSVGRIIP